MGINRPTAFILCSLSLLSPTAGADVATDGSLGPARALAGPDYAIGAELGRQTGGNLYHSFSRFSLGNAETARFQGPDSVRHIIGRVTGGAVSRIDGGLWSDIPGASLWLINPAGMLFGPNAWIDVDGSVHLGAAAQVLTADGARFAALAPSASTLSTAPPEGFGFVGNSAGAVQLDNSRLDLPEGETLSLAGSAIRATQSGSEPGSLFAPGGRIILVAVQGDGEVRLGSDGPRLTGALTGGPILLRSSGNAAEIAGALVDVSGEGGGDLYIRGADLVLDGATVASRTLGALDGGVIDIRVDSLRVERGGSVDAGGDGSGRGSDIRIVAGSEVRLTAEGPDGFGNISSGTFGPGPGGDLSIETPLLVVDGGFISNRPEEPFLDAGSPAAVGPAGDILLHLGRLLIVNGGEISTSTFGAQSAGDIHIRAAESVTVGGGDPEDGASVSADSFGSGRGGAIRIETPFLLIDGGAVFAESLGGDESGAPGSGGNIQLELERLVMRNGALVSSSTFSQARGGDVQVRASESVTLLGDPGDELAYATAISSDTQGGGDAGKLRIETGVLRVTAAEITSESLGVNAGLDPAGGNGGAIEIAAREVILEQGGTVSSTTFSSGDSGDVRIRADQRLVVRGSDGLQDSGIFANNQGGSGNGGQVDIQAGFILLSRGGVGAITEGSGPSGNITIQADGMRVANGGGLASSTFEGGGDGGNIIVRLNGDLVLIGQDSGIESLSQGEGRGGDIRIAAANIRLDRGAVISSEGLAGGAAGNIVLNAGDGIELRDGSAVLARAATHGGDVDLTAGGLLYLAHSTVSAAADGTARGDDGGNVSVRRPLFLVLNDSRILARAVGGDGGDILLGAEHLISDTDSSLDASSDLGVSGAVLLDAPESELVAQLRLPRLALKEQPELLDDPCRRLRYGEAGSSLLVSPGEGRYRIRNGRVEEMPPRPGDCRETGE